MCVSLLLGLLKNMIGCVVVRTLKNPSGMTSFLSLGPRSIRRVPVVVTELVSWLSGRQGRKWRPRRFAVLVCVPSV